jgi:hypothetical protein
MIRDNYKDICNSLIMNDEIFYRKIGSKIDLYSYGCPPSIWDLETISNCIDQDKLEKEIIFIDKSLSSMGLDVLTESMAKANICYKEASSCKSDIENILLILNCKAVLPNEEFYY